MADSAATRQRRHREHLRGNHTLCKGDCNPNAGNGNVHVEACHDLSDTTECYLEGDPGYDAPVMYAQVLAAAARAVDESPSPGSIRVFNEAFQRFAHATGRRYVL